MNKKTIYMSIGLLLLLITTITMTYAYFSVVAENNSKENIVETGTLSIHYEDGSEIIMNNMYPGESITKTFTVENTGSLEAEYNIHWKDLLNTIEKEELTYKLIINEEETTGVVPVTDENIKVGISIKPKDVHEYTLVITFIETNSAQNYNQGKKFNAKINVSESVGDVQIALKLNGQIVSELPEDEYYKLKSYECDNGSTITWNSIERNYYIKGKEKDNCTLEFTEADTIGTKIITDNVIYNDNENSEFVNNTTPGINFAAISSNTNGKGLYRTSDITKTEDTDGDGDGDEVLYFRGAVENNYLIFAGYCWRIVRTNEGGKSIKLRYGGVVTGGACPKTGTNVSISTSAFNSSNNNAKYVGYTYDTSTTDTTQTDSTAKAAIDTWYTNNIENQGTNVTSLIVDEPHCNDRSGSSTYGANTRLNTNKSPQYKCPNPSDKYTVSADIGNGKLKYPIALLTADEVAYAGGTTASANNSYYLYTGAHYWIMSPGPSVTVLRM